ncbi:hypothetical protein K440DRAFT_645968 [Wilcoxina mikolae CBS 423.85]|nr:hypothetical protein K440DRAFT_645968 [Wilcoxina mikolae CBS 423.85]
MCFTIVKVKILKSNAFPTNARHTKPPSSTSQVSHHACRTLTLTFHHDTKVPRIFRVQHTTFHPKAPETFYFFFYGTLTDPHTLAKVLEVNHVPITQDAIIRGYHCKLWGPYPALLDGPCNGVVRGVVYEVEDYKQKEKLEAYEDEMYESVCLIEFADGRKVRGRTFLWKGNPKDLRKGRFDLRDWQMRERR